MRRLARPHPRTLSRCDSEAVSGALTAGFVVVFGAFGLLVTPLALSVEDELPWVAVIIGIGLVALVIAIIAGRQPTLKIPKLQRGGSDGTLSSMFLSGVSYATASLSCTVGHDVNDGIHPSLLSAELRGYRRQGHGVDQPRHRHEQRRAAPRPPGEAAERFVTTHLQPDANETGEHVALDREVAEEVRGVEQVVLDQVLQLARNRRDDGERRQHSHRRTNAEVSSSQERPLEEVVNASLPRLTARDDYGFVMSPSLRA